MTLLITDLILSYTNHILHVPPLINSTEAIPFWIGPLMYFYTLSLVGERFQWHKHWPHLVPGAVQVISRIPFYLQSNAWKIRDTIGAFHRDTSGYRHVSPEQIWWYPGFHYLEGVWLDAF